MMPKIPNVYRDERRGTWYYVASLGTDADGNRVRVKRRGFATQAECKAAYDAFMAENRRGSRRADSSMTYGEFFRVYWLPEYRGRVRASTYSTRSALMCKHFAVFEGVRLRDIDAPMLKRWQNGLQERYSNGYVRLVFGAFAMSLDLAVRIGLLGENVARKVGNVRKAKTVVGFWTREEFERVAATFDTSGYYGLFGFTSLWALYMTGLRIGEFQALTWDGSVNIDAPAPSLSVTGSMFYRNASSWEITPPKTPASLRTVALDSLTASYLRRWREVQARECPSRFVYSSDGAPATKGVMASIIEEHARLAGVPRIRVHDLRHSHVALLISLGENALAIRDRLGHEDVKTTLGTYGHLFDNANYQVAARLDAAFGGGSVDE